MPPPFLPGNSNLESTWELEIAKSPGTLQSHCLEMSCPRGLCRGAQGTAGGCLKGELGLSPKLGKG